jgi:dienelactone hydrolase
MCFASTPRRPSLPADIAPIAGGAGAELLELESADGTRFSAALAESPEPRGRAVVILPDVRGLYPFYSELAERFAAAGHHAIAIDYFGRTAGLGPRGEDFEYTPHVSELRRSGVRPGGRRGGRRRAAGAHPRRRRGRGRLLLRWDAGVPRRDERRAGSQRRDRPSTAR